MKKLIAGLLAGAIALAPVSAFASEADLESRITALEQRVAALEAQLGIQSETSAQETEVTSAPATDALIFEDDGCSLQFVSAEQGENYNGGDMLVLYFDFVNNSDQTRSAMMTFNVQVFQNGKEMGLSVVGQANEAYNDSIAQIMPGADPVRVAFIRDLEDASDVIVRVSPIFSLDDNYLDIPLTLQ